MSLADQKQAPKTLVDFTDEHLLALRNEPDEVFYARHREKLIEEHGLSEAEADHLLAVQERLANIFFDKWISKNTKNTQ